MEEKAILNQLIGPVRRRFEYRMIASSKDNAVMHISVFGVTNLHPHSPYLADLMPSG